MIDDPPDDGNTLAAGDFSSWLGEMQGALCGDRGSDVPCNGCTACCTSSQFVHIGPDEIETLAHIPPDLLFPAPRLPFGHVLLGYDERGHCPMLIDNRCSIYAHRPRTCRTYDCRILPDAGLAGDDDKVLISRQAQRWQFTFPTPTARAEYDAVGTAVTYLDQHPDLLSDTSIPTSATRVAVLAVQVHHLFLTNNPETGQAAVVEPDPNVVRAEVRRLAGAADGV
jgi:hypothetical protein